MTPEIGFTLLGLFTLGPIVFLLVLFDIQERKEENEHRLAKEKRRKKKKLKYQS